MGGVFAARSVWLPVRLTLLQNKLQVLAILKPFDYQSDWHCSKTMALHMFDPQMFDYQSDWHCSKTSQTSIHRRIWFDYQSDWHCSKTATSWGMHTTSLITSQIDTAPKHVVPSSLKQWGLITSQIDTAPKLHHRNLGRGESLITSQIDTAPKLVL